ncbi:hypothetical protein V1524DRAFT_410820, partial [Lipomyces starkeyi]
MARLSGPSLAAAAAAAEDHEDYDEDVRQWIEVAKDSEAVASPGQINTAIKKLLDGGMDQVTISP